MLLAIISWSFEIEEEKRENFEQAVFVSIVDQS